MKVPYWIKVDWKNITVNKDTNTCVIPIIVDIKEFFKISLEHGWKCLDKAEDEMI